MSQIDDYAALLQQDLTTIEAQGPGTQVGTIVSATSPDDIEAALAGTAAAAIAPSAGATTHLADNTGLYSVGIWAVAAVAYLVVSSFLSPGEAAAISVLLILGALTVNLALAKTNNRGSIFSTLGLVWG